MARYARADSVKSYQVLQQVESQDEEESEASQKWGFALRLLRWWAMTTNPEFLISGASRRDLWIVLLPVPGLLNMFADRASSMLMLLDCAATVALIVASWLPAATLWSDVAVSAIHAGHAVTYVSIAMGSGPYFTVPSTLATCAMAFAGVHTLVLGSFVVLVSTVSTVQEFPWAPEQVLSCICIVFMSGAAEYRLASLFRDMQRQQEQGLSRAVHMSDFVPSRPAHRQQQHNKQVEVPSTAVGDSIRSRLANLQRQHRPVDTPAAATHEAPQFSDGEDKPAPLPPSPALPVAPEPWSIGPTAQAWCHVQVHEAPPKLPPAKALTSIADQSTSSTGPPSEEGPDPSKAGGPPLQKEGADPSKTGGMPLPQREAGPATAAASPELPLPWTDKGTLRALKLQGFKRAELNQLFIESQDRGSLVNGRETYWTSDGSHFLFFSQATNTWGLAKSKRLDQVRKGENKGIAHGPEGHELWNPSAAPLRGWREWDEDAGKWLLRLGSGIESRGKAKPRPSGESRATQTERRLLDKSVQTGR